jgi:DNA (cytosine-5)-methyltransferase 1
VRAFLMKYYGTRTIGQGLNEPCHTIRTNDSFGLVTVRGTQYAIVDIGMRMLQPRELFRAQSFRDDYIIDPEFEGKPLTKTAQVRMCGNSVPPVVAEALVRANVISKRQREEAAA